MKIKTLVLFATFIVGFVNFGSSQDIPLKLSDISLQIGENTINGEEMEIMLAEGKTSPQMVIVKSEGVSVAATFKLVKQNSRISEHKNTGIKLKINYVCMYEGQTKKEPVERMFYVNNDRKFDLDQSFYFQRGISNVKLHLKYTGELPE